MAEHICALQFVFDMFGLNMLVIRFEQFISFLIHTCSRSIQYGLPKRSARKSWAFRKCNNNDHEKLQLKMSMIVWRLEVQLFFFLAVLQFHGIIILIKKGPLLCITYMAFFCIITKKIIIIIFKKHF